MINERDANQLLADQVARERPYLVDDPLEQTQRMTIGQKRLRALEATFQRDLPPRRVQPCKM